jgi:hypothetical protein
VFKVKHLVCATGFGGGVPRMPDVPGRVCTCAKRGRIRWLNLAGRKSSRGWFAIRRGLRRVRNTLGRRRWWLGPALPVRFYVPLLADCSLTPLFGVGHDVALDFFSHGVDVTM